MSQIPSTVDHPPHYQSVSLIGLPILRVLNLGNEILSLECIEAIETLEADAPRRHGDRYDFCSNHETA